MKLALLKGNRFNPWHLQAFNNLRQRPDVTAFRADSEIQRYFANRDDGTLHFNFEPIHFDTQTGPVFRRVGNVLAERLMDREPRIAPFHDRLQSYDLIQTWELFTDWTAEAITARERCGVPVSVMVWDNIPFNMERNRERRAMKTRAAAAGDVFLVHTERSRRVLGIEGVPDHKIRLINPGVDTHLFTPGNGNRAEFGLDENEFVILFVGWLLPRKGIDFLILALRELLHDPALKHMRFRLFVVGSGPGKDRVEALIDRVGVTEHCLFAGSMPYNRMPLAFQSANVFVLPSIAMPEWQEQFGMAMLEAMASGVPVVTTYSGAIPEIVGDAAALCQPNDFVALYEAVKNLALNKSRRNDLAARGRDRVQQHFTLSQYAESLSTVYDELLANSRKG